MKIFAIGRNYFDHIHELGSEVPTAPVVFLKPDTALLAPGESFTYPDFSRDVHYELEVVLHISREAKNVSVDDASHFYDAISLGIDFTARDLQSHCKAKGLPWEISKAFDGSAAVGEFIDLPEDPDFGFQLLVNGVQKQSARTSQMIHSFAEQIAYISKFFTMQSGDLLFTGTPSGVGPVQPGDVLEGFLEGQQLLTCKIK